MSPSLLLPLGALCRSPVQVCASCLPARPIQPPPSPHEAHTHAHTQLACAPGGLHCRTSAHAAFTPSLTSVSQGPPQRAPLAASRAATHSRQGPAGGAGACPGRRCGKTPEAIALA